MADNLNEVTRAKIRDLCVELAAEKDFDADARDELRGELEDKLAGYVAGEVRPTEEDALVLARAHFGDADRVARSLSTFSAEVERQFAERKRTVSKLAVALALFMLLVLICAFLGMIAATSQSFGSAVSQIRDPDALKFLPGVLVFFAAIETGLIVAARVNLRKRWQRLTGAALILPSSAVCINMVLGGLPRLLAGTGDNLLVCVLFVLLTLAGLVGLVAHLWLIGLLLVPPPCDPMPFADKAYKGAA